MYSYFVQAARNDYYDIIFWIVSCAIAREAAVILAVALADMNFLSSTQTRHMRWWFFVC